jgi:hypothetical protein
MTRRNLRRRIVPDEVMPTGWRFAALCVLYPERAALLARWTFRRWAVLPGDRFEDFQCAERYEVLTVKRDHVVALATMYIGPDKAMLGRVVKAYRRRRGPKVFGGPEERCMSRWTPV